MTEVARIDGVPPPEVRVAWGPLDDGMPRRDASAELIAGLLPGAVVVRRCARCGSTTHGGPWVSDGRHVVSVSYTDRWAVAAVAPASFATALGVDAVAVTSAPVGVDRVLTAGADHRRWARVEAALKADGRGLTVEPADVTIEDAPDGFVARVGTAVFHGWDAPAPDGVVVSLAVRLSSPR